jgi:hypothetical protein
MISLNIVVSLLNPQTHDGFAELAHCIIGLNYDPFATVLLLVDRYFTASVLKIPFYPDRLFATFELYSLCFETHFTTSTLATFGKMAPLANLLSIACNLALCSVEAVTVISHVSRRFVLGFVSHPETLNFGIFNPFRCQHLILWAYMEALSRKKEKNKLQE